MTDDQRRVPIKVKVVDKRKTKPETTSDESEGVAASSAAPPAPLRQTVLKPPHGSAEGGTGDAFGVGAKPVREGTSSSDEINSRSVDAGFGFEPADLTSEGAASPAAVEAGEGEAGGHDYLDDLRRLQAEFDNFRKRTFKERQQVEARGKRALIEHLLPVLDNFERAIAHGEGGAGVELVFKELKSSLEREGLAEIPAEGEAFDPQVHEAVESVEDPDVEHSTVTQVYRRGYTFAGEVVRPAMVVVARPVDAADERVASDEDGDDAALDGAVGGA